VSRSPGSAPSAEGGRLTRSCSAPTRARASSRSAIPRACASLKAAPSSMVTLAAVSASGARAESTAAR